MTAVKFKESLGLVSFLMSHTREHWVAEHQFSEQRNWRFDFACPGLKIAIECEGGVYTNGRHLRPRGYLNDLEKYNAAAIAGWLLLRFPTDVISSGGFVRELDAAVLVRRNERWSEGRPGSVPERQASSQPGETRSA